MDKEKLPYAYEFWEQLLALDRIYSDYARRAGVSALQLGVLESLLEGSQEMTQKQLAQRSSNQKQAVNLVVRSLLERGYVTLRESPTDRRNKLVLLTPAGEEYARKLVLPFWEAEGRVLSGMSLEECRKLSQLLRLYADSLREELKEEGESKMLSLLRVNETSPYLPELMGLYERSFPANERRPLGPLLRDTSGAGEVFALLEGETFVGMASLLTWKDLTHILYFAVCEELRDQGYGTQILALFRTHYPGHRIIADVEVPKETSPNREQREKRIAFYEKNGYVKTSVAYDWRGESYRILSCGGDVSPEEFTAFWEHFYSMDAGYNY